MSRTWLAELRRIVVGGAVLAVAGLVIGHPIAVLLAGACAYLAWHLVQLYRVERWLEHPGRREPPPGAGVWDAVHSGLARLQRKNLDRKAGLREALSRFEQAAQASPDAALILRPRGEIEWLNRAATRLLGLRFPQDARRPIANLVRNPAFVSYLTAGSFDEPLEMVSPADPNLRLLVRVVPYGQDRRLLLVRDITRLHRLEEMRKDFVANVSHELRSPLTVIMGYLETLGDDAAMPATWRRPMEQMSHQARRMHLIVEDLLRLSRIENDPGGAAKTTVSVSDMLESIRVDALGLASEPPSLEIDADADVRLLGDYHELYSAFSNLVFNAVQYTPADGLVRLRWYADDEGAHLEVRDTGEGIEAHHIPRARRHGARARHRQARAHAPRCTPSGGERGGRGQRLHLRLPRFAHTDHGPEAAGRGELKGAPAGRARRRRGIVTRRATTTQRAPWTPVSSANTPRSNSTPISRTSAACCCGREGWWRSSSATPSRRSRPPIAGAPSA